jgi:hypothetical protein
MQLANPENSPFTNIVFVVSLACSQGGVLISSVAALLSMPIVALVSLALGLAGFTVLCAMLVVAVGAELARGMRNRAATDSRH